MSNTKYSWEDMKGFEISREARDGAKAFFNAEKAGTPHHRITDIVLIPGNPIFPTIHPGVDEHTKINEPMHMDHVELLRLGETTIQALSREKSRKVCPNVIFLSLGGDDVTLDTPLVNNPYKPHLLSSYASTLQNERQSNNLELHIAAHGSQEGIGSSTLDTRIQPEFLADMVASLLKNEQLSGRNLGITFHSCLSAYTGITSNKMYMDASESNKDSLMKESILESSYIGKFHTALAENGIRASVKGVPGYYSTLGGSSGKAVVSEKRDGTGESICAEKVTYEINHAGRVTIPRGNRDFPVEALAARVLEVDEMLLYRDRDRNRNKKAGGGRVGGFAEAVGAEVLAAADDEHQHRDRVVKERKGKAGGGGVERGNSGFVDKEKDKNKKGKGR